MSKKLTFTLVLIVLVLGSAGFAYYRLFMAKPAPTLEPLASTQNRNPFPLSESTSTARVSGTTKSATGVGTTSTTIGGGDLVELSSEPVSGATFITSPDSLTVRYNSRETGNIFDADLKTLSQTRISNTTLPNIYESLWLAGGKKSVFRYIKNETGAVQSYLFALGSSTISYGYYLPEDISSLAVSPTTAKVFYLIDTPTGTEGFVQNSDTQKKTSIFTSLLREWNAAWPNENFIALTTKPSANAPGFLYSLNPQTGAMKSVLSGIYGLTALVNPAGTMVIYNSNSLALRLYNIKTASSIELGPRTLPEKCVWSSKEKTVIYCAVTAGYSDGQYPDDWYQGTVSFSDNIYKIDTVTGGISSNFTVSTGDKPIDVTNLVLSSDESHLIFINKIDGSLWSLKIK